MTTKSFSFIAAAVSFVISGPALADPAKFDGTWAVRLVAEGGVCGDASTQTLVVQNGTIRGAGVSASGQVAPGGSVSLALQKGFVQGTASGKLSGASGSGSWNVSALGCSGRWTAQRRTVSARTELVSGRS